MRIPLIAATPLLLLALGLAAPASAPASAQTATRHAAAAPAKPAARTPKPDAPKSIGKFEDWQAATHAEGGQTVCYAFTRAQSSVPALPGRGDVVLTVTERPAGRDAVAISAGFAYAANAEVQVQVQADKAELAFYTSARSAFARDGHAATLAFATAARDSAKALAKSPGPKAATVTDTFSLRGYTAAYAAITKACPVK